MSLLMIARSTRGEEEAGRLELLRSLPIGPHAPDASAMAVVAGMDVAVGVLVTLVLLAQGLPARRVGRVRSVVHAGRASCSRASRWSRRR